MYKKFRPTIDGRTIAAPSTNRPGTRPAHYRRIGSLDVAQARARIAHHSSAYLPEVAYQIKSDFDEDLKYLSDAEIIKKWRLIL